MAVLMLGTFGPYVDSGIRTEQLVVYGAAVLALVLVPNALRAAPPVIVVVLHIWSLYAVVAIIGVIAPPLNTTRWPDASVAAGLDNVLLPLGAVMIAVTLATRTEPLSLARELSGWAVVLMMMNTVAAVLQALGIRDWSPWWAAEGSETHTVAASAAGNGRFSGLINQPAEAGLLYGVAMLAALYLWSARPRMLFVVLSVTAYGGFLTVSKVFLLIAVPLTVWQLLRLPNARVGRAIAVVAGVLSTYITVQAGWLPGAVGGQLQQILPHGKESFLSAVTASRFGESSTLRPVVEAVWSCSPLSGMGAGGLLTPYDNGFVEAFVVAGLLGIFCYAATLMLFARASWQMPRSPERMLFGSLVLLATGASLGLPALTANRAATVLWLLMTALAVEGYRATPLSDGPHGNRSLVHGGTRQPIQRDS